MFTVYRLEHSVSGRGPFRNLPLYQMDSIETYDNRHYCHKKYPTRTNDSHIERYSHGWSKKGKKFIGDEYITGCTSKEWINYWFNTIERVSLLRNGYILRKYRVKSIILGGSGTQCFFKKEDILETL